MRLSLFGVVLTALDSPAPSAANASSFIGHRRPRGRSGVASPMTPANAVLEAA
jgi:hypothetical protein